VLFGSVGGFTIYLLLIRDWGPSGAGAYAFISPVIAVALGTLLFGERVGLAEAAGIVLMLSAAMLAPRKHHSAPPMALVPTRKSAIVLKSGFRCRSSQITSMLRWVSASNRRLERTRLR
jgi:hypothetical protein